MINKYNLDQIDPSRFVDGCLIIRGKIYAPPCINQIIINHDIDTIINSYLVPVYSRWVLSDIINLIYRENNEGF